MPDVELPEDRSSLREARERRGRSLEEIADTTKISVSALEALERYDASSLPGGIFTRAFVRSYATEVGLDPETALREFLARCPEADPVEVAGPGEASAPGHLGLGGSRPIGLRLALLAAPLVALAVFVGVRACDDRASARVSDSEAQAVAEVSADAPPARRAPPRTTVPPPTTPVEGAPLVMEILPSRDCWVAATVDGEAVLSRLMRAGERQTLRAVEAITVNVGDAGAFEYTLNEEPGRLLGGRGQVVTETITPDNYRDYLSR
ncbi:MAG: helix-turn-helix domain-containing protein [Acidobacteria bacterium]|nr:helix-turn-helix domain-containing protein [Acidobacteriota bacterium]